MGLGVLTVASATPVLEFVLFENDEVDAAVRNAWGFATDRWSSWVLPQLAILMAVSFAWLVTVGLSSVVVGMIDERLLVFAELIGAAVFGPLVHLVLVQRGVMFLELRRLTHRQRMFQVRG